MRAFANADDIEISPTTFLPKVVFDDDDGMP